MLLAGYALGGAPGFAVGAVAALASNLFFGQGPWTPWQMVALGAASGCSAARARARSPGASSAASPLAAACALAGLLFGAVMNLSLWITYSGDHTLGQARRVFATSLPFDIAHALGNVVFCLAFGPALVRALRRFRTRFEVTWRPAGGRAPRRRRARRARRRAAGARSAPRAAAARVVDYLERAQNRDGGFGRRARRRARPDAHGLGGARPRGGGRNPRDVARGGHDVVDYIRAHAGALRGDLGDARARSSRCAAGGRRRARRRPRPGRRAARAAQRATAPSPAASTRRRSPCSPCARPALGRATARAARGGAHRGQANDDGGFNFAGRGGAVGRRRHRAPRCRRSPPPGGAARRVMRRAARWLVAPSERGRRLLAAGRGSNAQSTAWAIQGLIAAGRDPRRRSRARAARASRASRLPRDAVWVTAQR